MASTNGQKPIQVKSRSRAHSHQSLVCGRRVKKARVLIGGLFQSEYDSKVKCTQARGTVWKKNSPHKCLLMKPQSETSTSFVLCFSFFVSVSQSVYHCTCIYYTVSVRSLYLLHCVCLSLYLLHCVCLSLCLLHIMSSSIKYTGFLKNDSLSQASFMLVFRDFSSTGPFGMSKNCNHGKHISGFCNRKFHDQFESIIRQNSL